MLISIPIQFNLNLSDSITDTNTHLNIPAYTDTDIETGKKTHSDIPILPIPILPIC